MKKRAEKQAAVFVASTGSLSAAAGGQQVCTAELKKVLKTAGFELHETARPYRLGFMARLRHRIRPVPYPKFWKQERIEAIVDLAGETGGKWIFFNLIDFLPVARLVRGRVGRDVRLVMLSHGLASPDVRQINRIAGEMPEIIGRCPRYDLEAVLKKEREYLGEFDQVISLAEFEADLCREMGARRSDWIPRVIPEQALEWRPVEGRLGFVGTLDHPPSMEGMVKVLEAWPGDAGSGVKVRVVSRSRWHGEWLAKRFSQVEYLGPLDGGEMEKEAASWCAFLHPMFCFARGCSTKLATGLGWRIPCLSTASGVRGYELPKGAVVMAETAEEFAKEAVRTSRLHEAKQRREQLMAVSGKFLTWETVGQRVADILEVK